MENYKKSFIGVIAAAILGTSCCWITSLVIWLGGLSALSVIVNYSDNLQIVFGAIALALLIISIYLFINRNSK